VIRQLAGCSSIIQQIQRFGGLFFDGAVINYLNYL
jgi:hypothetical protein